MANSDKKRFQKRKNVYKMHKNNAEFLLNNKCQIMFTQNQSNDIIKTIKNGQQNNQKAQNEKEMKYDTAKKIR